MKRDEPLAFQVRKRLGLSRSAFARFLGCAEITIHRWETHKSPPTGIALEVLRGLLDANPRKVEGARLAEVVRRGGR